MTLTNKVLISTTLLISMFFVDNGTSYTLPDADGGDEHPSPECLMGEIISVDGYELLVRGIGPEGSTFLQEVGVSPETDIFTVNGGLVFSRELTKGIKLKVWFQGISCMEPNTPISAAVIMVASKKPYDDWPQQNYDPAKVRNTLSGSLREIMTKDEIINGEFSAGYKSEYDYFNNDLRIELEKREIPYVINAEGKTTFPQSYSKTVKSIINELRRRPVTYVFDTEYLGLLKKAFTKNRIKYSSNFVEGKKEYHVFWGVQDDAKARKILNLPKSKLRIIFEK